MRIRVGTSFNYISRNFHFGILAYISARPTGSLSNSWMHTVSLSATGLEHLYSDSQNWGVGV